MFSESGAHGFQNEFGNEVNARMPRLFGDFYREDDVMRGITMPSTRSSGDFYREESQGVRGITMPSTSINFNDLGNPYTDSDFGWGKPSCAKYMGSPGIASAPAFRFEDGDEPPELSPQVSAHMEDTRLQVNGFSSREVGNILVAILTDTIGARVTKLNRSKFTVRAQAFLSGLYCEVKVRVYKQNAARDYAVEFQKRNGDSIAFGLLFQQAKEALHGSGAERTGLSAKARVNIPATVVLPPEHSIAPLLGMAATTQDVNLLAEVALSLAILAQNAQVAAELRMPCAYSVLQELEHINDFRVADPTSRVLSCVYGY
jgi:hypothetical protein